MKISLSWLKEYLPNLSHPPEVIAEVLTSAGLEVDSFKQIGSSFRGVVVATVQDVLPHPQADRLVVAQVFDGKENFQIVCGAPNCQPGLTVALAKIGASLPNEEGGSWSIKKNKLRGVESFGMLCGWDELGLPGPTEGLAELPSNLTPGEDLSTIYADVIFDISLTPNLGHCMSVYGIARELSAFLSLPLKEIEISLPFVPNTSSSTIEISIDNAEDCPRYDCKLVSNIQVASSPDWLQKQLTSVGIRSINNVVDISNYVMIATGQPVHFFDYDKLEGKKLSLKQSNHPVKLHTLDGTERLIPPGTLLIADNTGPVAIAGIMGTSKAEISNTTNRVLIEAAVFHPGLIRKASRSLGLKTDAAARFEKGVDIEAVPKAISLAVKLLIDVASGTVSQETLDLYPQPKLRKKILCRKSKINGLIGIQLSLREIIDQLSRLSICTVKEEEDSIIVEVPSYRNDIQEEIDIIEEIARLYGFTNISYSAAHHSSSTLSDAPLFLAENTARSSLIKEGLQEFLTCDLISPTLSSLVENKINKDIQSITTLQSKSGDYSVLRTSLLPGLLQVVKYNTDHKNFSVAGFEVGRIHFKQGDSFEEFSSVGIILSGLRAPYHYDPKPTDVDFFDLKGIIENFLAAWKITNFSFTPSDLECFQPGKQAHIHAQGALLGSFGEIHPDLRQTIDLSQRVFYAEIDLHELLRLQPQEMKMQELPQMPSSERDWTVTLAKEVPVGTLLQQIRDASSALLETVFLLDSFESDKLGQDKKNITCRFVYRDPHKTLEFETVEQEHRILIQKVEKKLGTCIISS